MGLIKNLSLTVLSFGLVLIAGNFSYAKDYEYKNLDIKANVEIDGTVNVKETFDANFLERKHGIVRAIPLNYSVEGKYFHLDISDVKVEGSKFSTNINGGDFEIKIGNADKTVIGEQIYPISYSVYGLVRNFSGMGYSELYWNVVGYDFDTNINSVNAEINLPKKNSFSSGDFLITVDGKENSVGTFAGKIDWSQGDKIIIRYDKKLFAGEGITLAVKFPNDYFEFDHDKQASLIGFVGKKTSSSNIFSDCSGSFFKILAIIIGSVVVVGSIFRNIFTRISSIFTFNKGAYIHKSEIEDKLNKETPIVVRYDPPQGISCAEAGMLYNCILEPADLTSLLYKWIVEGLISVHIEGAGTFEKKDGFILTKLKDIDKNRPSYEVKFFEYLLPGAINSKKALSKSSTFEISNSLKSLRSYGKSKGWVTVGGFSDYKNYIGFFCSVVLFLVLLMFGIEIEISAIIALILSSFFAENSNSPYQKKISLTEEGKKIALNVIGYAKFIQLCDENKLRLFLKQDPAFFDKTLPYAVAFGFETSFIKKITPILRELDVKPSGFDGDIWEMDSISLIVRDIVRQNELRKQRESENHSTYDRSSGFSSGSSFSFGGFSRGGGGGGGGSRSW